MDNYSYGMLGKGACECFHSIVVAPVYIIHWLLHVSVVIECGLISFTALENHTKQYIKFDKVDIYHIQLYKERERKIFCVFQNNYTTA